MTRQEWYVGEPSKILLPPLSPTRETLRDSVNGLPKGEQRHRLSEELLKKLMKEGGAFRVALAVRYGNSGVLTAVPLYPAERWPENFRSDVLPLNAEKPSACVRAFVDRQPFWVYDTKETGAQFFEVSVPTGEEIRSSLTLPLLRYDVAFGVAALEWLTPREKDPALIDRLVRLTAPYAEALAEVSLDTQLKDLLNQFLEQIQENPKEEKDYKPLLQLFADAVDAHAGTLFLNRPGDANRFYPVASLHSLPGAPELPVNYYRPNEGLTGWVLGTHMPLRLPRIDDTKLREAYAPNLHWSKRIPDIGLDESGNATSLEGPNPYLCVPVTAGNQLFGCVRLRRTHKRTFSEQDLYLLAYYAGLFGAAVARCRESQGILHANTLTEMLNNVDRPQEILEEAVKAVDRFHGRCELLIRGEKQVHGRSLLYPLYYRATPTSSVEVDLYPIEEHAALSGWVVHHKVSRYVPDLKILTPTEKTDLQHLPLNDPWRAAYALPLNVDKRLKGAMLLMSLQPAAYSSSDLEFLWKVAQETMKALAKGFALASAELTQKVADLTSDFQGHLLEGGAKLVATKETHLQRLLFDTLSVLQQTLGADYAFLGLPDSRGKHLVMYNTSKSSDVLVQVRSKESVTLPLTLIAALELLLGDGPSRQLDDVDELMTLARSHPGAKTLGDWSKICDSLREKHQRLLFLPLRTEGRLRAIFVLVLPELCLLGSGLVQDAVKALQRLQKLLVLADRFAFDHQIAHTRAVMTYVGHKASDLRHRYRQPLDPIRLALANLLQPTSLEEVREDVGDILGAFAEFEDLLNEFDRDIRQDEPRSNVDLVQVLRELVQTPLAIKLPKTDLLLPSDPVVIWGRKRQLVSAFRRLYENACQALEKRQQGLVTLRLIVSSDEIQVRVEDNGPGMSTEAQETLGQPLVSHGGGMGLGFAQAQLTVIDHEGRLEVESDLGTGTRVIAHFPRSTK